MVGTRRTSIVSCAERPRNGSGSCHLRVVDRREEAQPPTEARAVSQARLRCASGSSCDSIDESRAMGQSWTLNVLRHAAGLEDTDVAADALDVRGSLAGRAGLLPTSLSMFAVVSRSRRQGVRAVVMVHHLK